MLLFHIVYRILSVTKTYSPQHLKTIDFIYSPRPPMGARGAEGIRSVSKNLRKENIALLGGGVTGVTGPWVALHGVALLTAAPLGTPLEGQK